MHVQRSAIRVASLGAADQPLLAEIADLIVAAAQRGEALALSQSITAGQYRDYLAALLDQAARGDAGLIAAFAADGSVIGSSQWTRSPYPTRRVLAELDRVAVLPEARGGGAGRALVEAAAYDAARHGIEVLTLEVRGNNLGAIALYERTGFRRYGLAANVVALGDARHDMVLMSRELGRPARVALLGSLPAGLGASLPYGTTEGPDWQHTGRLLLCRPSAADADAYFAIHGDPATNLHNPAGAMIDPSAAAPVLELWERHWRESGYGYWTVREPRSGRVLGFAGVRPPAPEEDFLNLYYRFRPTAWGRGYATEVGRIALALAARMAPGLPVVALIRPKNAPSIQVAERLGLKYEGEVERQFGIYLKYAATPSRQR